MIPEALAYILPGMIIALSVKDQPNSTWDKLKRIVYGLSSANLSAYIVLYLLTDNSKAYLSPEYFTVSFVLNYSIVALIGGFLIQGIAIFVSKNIGLQVTAMREHKK